MKFKLATAAAALALAATPASAVIVSITLSGGTAFTNGGVGQIIASPASVATVGGNNDVFGFNERTSISLSAIPANQRPTALVAPTFPTPGVRLTDSVTGGQRVSSHFFIFAPGASRTVTGTIVFNQNIIGLQRTAGVIDGAQSTVLRAAGTAYALAATNGLEAADTFKFVDNKTLQFSLTGTATNKDMFSIITGVPEAPTWAMLIAGFGLVGLGARRRRAVAA